MLSTPPISFIPFRPSGSRQCSVPSGVRPYIDPGSGLFAGIDHRIHDPRDRTILAVAVDRSAWPFASMSTSVCVGSNAGASDISIRNQSALTVRKPRLAFAPALKASDPSGSSLGLPPLTISTWARSQSANAPVNVLVSQTYG